MKKIKVVTVLFLIALFSAAVYADRPKGDGNGGVSCDPGCHRFECHPNGDCIACNDHGCTFIPAVKIK